MSFNVTFYNNKSDNRQVHKQITSIKTVVCEANDEMDIINPSIRIVYDGDIISANYMYIPKLNRYYYITNIEIPNGNILVVSGHCDVLMSFWPYIKNCQCVAGRSTSNYDEYLDDPMISIKNTYRTETRRLSGEFTPTAGGSNHYVLSIGGME